MDQSFTEQRGEASNDTFGAFFDALSKEVAFVRCVGMELASPKRALLSENYPCSFMRVSANEGRLVGDFSVPFTKQGVWEGIEVCDKHGKVLYKKSAHIQCVDPGQSASIDGAVITLTFE